MARVSPAGLAGTAIGLELGAKDRRAALAAEYRALEYGATGDADRVARDAPVRGEVVAGPLYKVNDYDCRQYTHTITVKGKIRDRAGHRLPGPERRVATGRMTGGSGAAALPFPARTTISGPCRRHRARRHRAQRGFRAE